MHAGSTLRLAAWHLHAVAANAPPMLVCPQITPHVITMWRPDLGKYTGHMQRPAPPGATVIADAQCNVIPQFAPVAARALGSALRTWQGDAFNTVGGGGGRMGAAGHGRGTCAVSQDACVHAANKPHSPSPTVPHARRPPQDVPTYALQGDRPACASALMTLGAPWATRPGPLTQPLAVSTPMLEGVAPTNQVCWFGPLAACRGESGRRARSLTRPSATVDPPIAHRLHPHAKHTPTCVGCLFQLHR